MRVLVAAAAITLAAALPIAIAHPALAAKRTIVVTAVEPKGTTNVEKEPYPTQALPEGGGYKLKEPDDSGDWRVSAYVFDPRQIIVDEGDEVTLEFVGINGALHPITISGYDKMFELKRGQVTQISFTADKPGVFSIVCATHHPSMVAELIVEPK